MTPRAGIRRTRLAEAQNWRCVWCHRTCEPTTHRPDSATVEHLVPRSRGGSDADDNLVMACHRCNGVRGHMALDRWLAVVATGAHLPAQPAALVRLPLTEAERKVRRRVRIHARIERILIRCADGSSWAPREFPRKGVDTSAATCEKEGARPEAASEGG